MADSQRICRSLVAEGWLSPDTYSNAFSDIGDFSAVYLFLLYDRESHYQQAVVAYVGMSVNLRQRLCGHNILPMLAGRNRWVMRWFKPVKAPLLRDVEHTYIEMFNPPWNIIGRQRGMMIS